MGIYSLRSRYESLAPTTLVTSGLTLALDAANPNSYPGSGATWFDTSGNSNNMTLTGSPTWTGSVFQFNGSSQYGALSLNYSTTTYTIMGASRYSGATRGRVISSISNNWLLGHHGSTASGLDYYAEGWVSDTSASDTDWRIYTAVENYSADRRTFYVNNVPMQTDSTAGSQGFNGLAVGRWGNGTEYSTCEVAFIFVWNRVLNSLELTQNYNAVRGRFGL